MKKIIFGTFNNHHDAERCITELHRDFNVSLDAISYIYRDMAGAVQSDPSRAETIVDSSASGAAVGATLGTVAGIATVAGVIPLIGPVFAAGPLIAALGLGAGAAATTAAGAVTGAVAGGVVGALVEWGVPSEVAESYQERLNAGDILVAIMTDNESDLEKVFVDCNATSVTTETIVNK